MSCDIGWREQLPYGGCLDCVLTHLMAVDLLIVAYGIWRGLLSNRVRKAIIIHIDTDVRANTI